MAPVTGALQPSVCSQCETQMVYSILHGVSVLGVGSLLPIYCQPYANYSVEPH